MCICVCVGGGDLFKRANKVAGCSLSKINWNWPLMEEHKNKLLSCLNRINLCFRALGVCVCVCVWVCGTSNAKWSPCCCGYWRTCQVAFFLSYAFFVFFSFLCFLVKLYAAGFSQHTHTQATGRLSHILPRLYFIIKCRVGWSEEKKRTSHKRPKPTGQNKSESQTKPNQTRPSRAKPGQGSRVHSREQLNALWLTSSVQIMEPNK